MSEDHATRAVIEQEQMNEFGAISAGTGRIHTDPDYAAATPFGRTVVQGIYLAALIEKELTERSPEWAETGTLDLRFVSPVRAGEEFAIAVEPAAGDAAEPGSDAGEASGFRIELTTSEATAVRGTAALDLRPDASA